ncbi:tetratricopeptide repeat protein [Bacillus badius]|uniref:Uncharacterized protein n=1 Tax=Bacillus badius TaxID=1455 RepID=A0ABR5APG3_BACBA|nr:tetratricopeptide repeat protein [Bacillus badius]KIL74229.1 hypothetical protein SD77_2884 [Bacillus badius]KZR57173.1 hypothetical protein A3781_20165 [Bacillus badius]MED0666939.1 tetratricopeptide repeat protein [Bacillus badius]MED4717283.1 tetratricopeptide repeat protein [Bacillus badius]
MIQNVYTKSNYTNDIFRCFESMSNNPSDSKCFWIEGVANFEELTTGIFNVCSGTGFVFHSKLNRMNRSLLKPFRDFLLENSSTWLKWDWIKDYKYELQTLFPKANENSPDIFSISWGWSEVRLNREIQWGFRLIHFISSILKKLAEDRPVVILLEDFQNSDRLSIYCINHLLNNLKLQNLIFVLNVKDYQVLSNTNKLDNGIEITELLTRLKKKVDPVFIRGGINTDNDESKHYLVSNDNLKDNISTCVNCLIAGNAKYNDVLEKLHHSLLLFNLENVLFLGDIILNNLNQFDTKQQQRLCYEVWRHVGIAQVFMDDFSNAINSFLNMKMHTDSIGEQVKACHLIATIYGKRLKKIDEAKTYIQKGLNLAGQSKDFRTLYEKGWLYNYIAFVSYSIEKDFKKAMEHVTRAMEFVQPYKNHTPDSDIMDEIGNPISAERLLGNLKANASYLNFYKGNNVDALEEWKDLKADISNAPEIFKKEYFYFEGNLLLCLGKYNQAIESLKKSYIICGDFKDTFHQEIVSRKLGYAYFLMNQYQESMNFYKESLQLKKLLGKPISNKHYQSILLCYMLSGDSKNDNKEIERLQELVSQEFLALHKSSQIFKTNPNRFLEDGPVILLEPFPMMIL